MTDSCNLKSDRYSTDPEFRRRSIEASKRWASANRQRIAERRRERYAQDPEYRNSQIAKSKNWRKANPLSADARAVKVAATLKRRKNDPDHHRRARELMAAWRAANPDRVDKQRVSERASKKKRYATNPELRKHISEKSKEWIKANPGKARMMSLRRKHSRRARERDAFVEVVDPATVLALAKGRCGICLKIIKDGDAWELDHIVPLAKGGAHCYDNVQPAHPECNRRKAARVPVQPKLFQVAR